jgi:hypothetical protein
MTRTLRAFHAAPVVAFAALVGALAPGAHATRPDGPASMAGGTTPSQAIFPPQVLPLRFDHKVHVQGRAMACTECHPGAATSRLSSDRLLPAATVCDGCHETDHADLNAVGGDAGRCSGCHVGHAPQHGNRVARVVLPRPNLRFDHRAHAVRNIGCRQCHAAVAERGLATRADLPTMRRCFDCHAAEGPSAGDARAECPVCHLTTEGDRLVTQFASGNMLPPRWLHGADHGPGWIERHKAVAAADSAFCSSCHAERECVDCHDGRVRPRRIHPNDWLSLHAVSARQASSDCGDCHRQQTFCVTCHQRVGVAMRAPTNAASGRGRFHPPTSIWTAPPRSAGHHAWEAQRNMDVCVSCHTERDCATCHATQAAGATRHPGTRTMNPHPPGFRTRCQGPFRRNARPCLVCHDPADPILAACR